MTAAALLRKSDARRFGQLAKEQGIAIRVKVGELEVTFLPDIPKAKPEFDEVEDIRL